MSRKNFTKLYHSLLHKELSKHKEGHDCVESFNYYVKNKNHFHHHRVFQNHEIHKEKELSNEEKFSTVDNNKNNINK